MAHELDDRRFASGAERITVQRQESYWPMWPVTVEVVPGHSLLGKGFNIFGRYDSSSALKTLFDTSKRTNAVWRNPISDRWYLVPENVDDPLPLGDQEGDARIFASRTDVSEFFAAEANLSLDYKGFSAEFDNAFSSIAHAVFDHNMALYYVKSRNFRLRLQDDGEAKLAAHVLSDPDFKALPETFVPADHDNVMRFFAFFQKYGTHYVNEVVMGARLNYYAYGDKAYTASANHFEARLKAEVKAVLFSAGGTAKAEWEALGKNWSESRTVKISGVGSISILNSLVPEYGQNFHDIFVQWLATAQINPLPLDFKLKPVHAIFSGARAHALRQATNAYAAKSISLNAVATAALNAASNHTRAYVNLNEAPVVATPSGKAALGAAVIDATTLAVKFQKAYEFDGVQPAMKAYDNAYADLKAYEGKADVIIAIVIHWARKHTQYPSADFYNLLINLGAGDALQRWWAHAEVTESSNKSPATVSYGIIGTFRGARQGSVDALAGYVTQERSGQGLILDVFLRPECIGHAFSYVPC